MSSEGAAQGNALAFSAGEALGKAVEEMGNGEGVCEGVDSCEDFTGGAAADAESEGELFADWESGEESGVLGDVADAAEAWGEVGDVIFAYEDAAGAGGAESADEFEEGGFALACAAGEYGIESRGDGEGEVGEAESTGVPGDLIELDHRRSPAMRTEARTRIARATMRRLTAMAASRLPTESSSQTVVGRTSVRIRVAPAKTRMGPNSPRLRAHAMLAAANIPRRAAGRVTRQTAVVREQPRVIATSSGRGERWSKVPRMVRTAKAAPMTHWARMTPAMV
jgi:hypothetical protein